MILVTVGMHFQGFDRLIKRMDELAKGMDEDVIMQIGCTTYEPQNTDYFRFTSTTRMEELTRQADVVVSHAAAGAIITAFKCGAPLIVVPRLKRFAEHADDHQVQLAELLSREGRVRAVYDVRDLGEALAQTRRVSGRCGSATTELAAFLRDYVEHLEQQVTNGQNGR